MSGRQPIVIPFNAGRRSSQLKSQDASSTIDGGTQKNPAGRSAVIRPDRQSYTWVKELNREYAPGVVAELK
ncbi:hypothetical protein N7523_007438 [Penicillium sp. IBT 18751x]|nr:hypothetical protein N7523_007438 [Penicillium sp. IBT 18751x]